MRLIPPETVRTLQNALHAKAKQAPSYRFYTLYDKIYRADVLRLAYRCSLANAGAPGVDGQTFEQIEAYGRQRWLDGGSTPDEDLSSFGASTGLHPQTGPLAAASGNRDDQRSGGADSDSADARTDL